LLDHFASCRGKIFRLGDMAAVAVGQRACPKAPLEPFGQHAPDGFGGVAIARTPVPQDRPHDGARLFEPDGVPTVWVTARISGFGRSIP
jgi:hypothetical protein